MSSAYLICCCDRVPADAHKTPAVIASMIDDVNRQARGLGWDGAAFSRFSSIDGILQFDVVPGDRLATIEDLRAFHDAEKRRKAEEVTQAVQPAEPPQQGALL